MFLLVLVVEVCLWRSVGAFDCYPEVVNGYIRNKCLTKNNSISIYECTEFPGFIQRLI